MMYAGNLRLKKRESRYFKAVRLRFYAELNNFLPQKERQKSFDYSFPGPITVKEVIESMKVPPAEVDLILVNGVPEGFDYHVKDADYISVYPVFEQFDISSVSMLRKIPLRITKFILDAHLGKLAKYLRMFGFDTLYENNYPDDIIRKAAYEDSRIILTRDRDLLNHKDVTHGYFVRAIHPKDQLAEIIEKFDLASQTTPFTRCLECNHPLEDTKKDDIQNEVDPDTFKIYNDFYKCPNCRKIYWEGSHYEHMKEFIANNINSRGSKGDII